MVSPVAMVSVVEPGDGINSLEPGDGINSLELGDGINSVEPDGGINSSNGRRPTNEAGVAGYFLERANDRLSTDPNW